jgi:hypothetical protein
MDYTVIGDMVNLASRMEGLTKNYHADLLISETLYDALRKITGKGQGQDAALSFRLLDSVAVKGKTKGVKIYTAKKNLPAAEAKAWELHNQGMEHYYRRDFAEAAKRFQAVLSVLKNDFNAENLLQRCKNYAVSPPPPGWDGVEVMHTK